MKKRDHDKIKKQAIESSYRAIEELDKVLNQNIDLEELDPEKARAAVLGKAEAQDRIFLMLDRIKTEEEGLGLRKVKEEKDITLGPEKRK